MNTYQAKRIPLRDVLSRLGCEPVREVRGELWYLSPFRQETEASFKINPEKNLWYDFGAATGGNILDLMMTYQRLITVAEALRELEHLMCQPHRTPSPAASVTPAKREAAPDDGLRVTKVQPLQNRALIDYLGRRGIEAGIARPYVQEMYYTRGGKPYFALAFANDSGGFELRNPYFKGVQGKKSITLLWPSQDETPTAVHVFEGFMDFLSALAYRPASPALPALVLNSVAMRERAVQVIREKGVSTVHLYLDRDESGRNLTGYLQQELAGRAIVDQSGLYEGYKDFNALVAGKRLAHQL